MSFRTYYAASYGPRYGDPIAIFVALVPLTIERKSYSDQTFANELAERAIRFHITDLAERSCAHDIEDYPGYCDDTHDIEDYPESDCALHNPDLVSRSAFAYDARSLFSAQELAEHRRELIAGETIVLYR